MFVQGMLKNIISSEATPKNVTRIGEKPQGNRPLKVEFRDVVERDDILKQWEILENQHHRRPDEPREKHC